MLAALTNYQAQLKLTKVFTHAAVRTPKWVSKRLNLQDLKKHFAVRSFCSPCCQEATNCLHQHRERHWEQILTEGCVAQQLLVPVLPLENSLIKVCLDAPAFTSALEPAHCKASSLECSGGQSKAIQRLKLLQSLVIAGALIAYCLMASWALTQRCQIADEQNHRNRKFTLFPAFTDDKTFLTVIVLCFSEGMRNPLLPSTAA